MYSFTCDLYSRSLHDALPIFSHPRYMNGAATNPDFQVVCQAAAQVKSAIDATIALGGDGYVFWGGRGGYMHLFNTSMRRELDHLGTLLRAARDDGRRACLTGTVMSDAKPMETAKQQHDLEAS